MPKKNYIEITEDVWEKIKNEYITTDISIRGLEKKYGIPFTRLRARIEAEGWKNAKDECKSKIAQKSIDLLVEHKAEEVTKAFRIANSAMDKLSECIEQIDASDIDATRKLKNITSAIKDLKEIGVFRSALDEAEQKARIRKLQKDAEEESKDISINISFEEGMDEYAD